MKVETCCGCFCLRTGTIIIGIFGIVCAIAWIIINSLTLQKITEDDRKVLKQIHIGSSCFSLVLNALLLFGAIKKSRYFLLPWLIVSGIGFSLAIFGLPVLLILTFSVIPLLLLVNFVLLMLYLWIIVLSYYKELTLQATCPAVNEDGQQYPTVPGGVAYVIPQPPTYPDDQKGPQVVSDSII